MSWLREPDAEPIPGYRLVAPIGSGGFGEVWKCIAPGGIDKAIKFVFGSLNSDDGDFRAEQEQKALMKVKDVRHPFILSMDRIEVIGDELAIVMELADKSLHDLLKEFLGRGAPGVPRGDVLRYMRDAADGLDHLIERHNLQHLDVKPRNLFLIADRVKVADFGLVKHLDRQNIPGLLGGVFSPIYSAPETFTDSISKHSDQYSLAIVYCELLSNRRPFAAKNMRQLAMLHMHSLPDLSMIPEPDRPIVAKALAKDPSKRFPTCAAFIAALAANVASEVVSAQPVISEADDAGWIENEAWDEAPVTDRIPKVSPDEGTAIFGDGLPRYRLESDALNGDAADSAPNSAVTGLGGLGGNTAAYSNGYSSHENAEAIVDLGAPALDARIEVPLSGLHRGVLRPTMFIGLGSFGRRALIELRCRLLDRFGDPGDIPSFRFLLIDSDTGSLDQATQGSPEAALRSVETFPLPLQPVIKYRRRMIDHLVVWLPTEKLHSIPRSLQPQGSRALGRLAFIDNFPRLQNRLRREFQVAAHSDSIAASVEHTGLARGKDSPRVFVFASACGGSSGSLVDLGYCLRRLLRQLNHAEAPLTLFTFCGAPTDPSTSRLELANAYATLLEINSYRSSGTTYHAEFGPDGPSITDTGTPYDAVYLSVAADRTPERFCDAVAHLATYVTQEVSSPLGPNLAESRRGESKAKPQFRSFGTNTTWFPRGLLLRVAARQVVARLTEVWQAKVPALDASVEKLCDLGLCDPGLEWKALRAELNRLAHSPRLGNPIEATEQFIATLAADAASPPALENAGRWAIQALESARRFAGPGTGRELEARWKKSQFYGELTRASQQLGEQWDAYLAGHLSDLIRRPGHRIATAEAGIRYLSDYCMAAMRKQWDAIEQHYKGMKRCRDDLESAVQACQGGVKILFSGAARALRHLADCLAEFCRQRVIQDLLEAGVQFYMTLQARLDDRLRDMDFVRQRVKTLSQSLQGPSSLIDSTQRPEWGLGAELSGSDPYWEAVQATSSIHVVLPAGVTELEESARQFVETLSTDHWLEMDQCLQTEILAPMGDLMNAATSGPEAMSTLGRPLVAQAAVYLGSALPITDVAQVERPPSGKFDNKFAARFKLQVNAACPPIEGNGEEAFLLVPATESGQELARAARAVCPSLQCVLAANPIEVTIVREYTDLPIKAIEELFGDAKVVYQDVCAVPALSPHSRFDMTDWSALTPSLTHR